MTVMHLHWPLLVILACGVTGAPAQAADSRLAVRPFELGDVRLLDGPFKAASERNAQYLLRLEPDRLLHNTLKYAGLEPKGERYGGWEARGIAGHTLGHYLTALAQQFAASGDARFRERLDYVVAEMARAQEAYGDGYVGALPPLELATLRGLREGRVEPENPFVFAGGAWVPWYTQHKVLAGLRDAWVIAGSAQAGEVALALADWVVAVTSPLSEADMQKMLSVEHGGMSAVLMDLYARTGEARYRRAAERFQHHAVLDPLRAGRDALVGLHANTQIPKITGAALSYEVTGAPDGRTIAETFWDSVTGRHSWVIGGNSEGEHFFEPAEAASRLTPATAETCNTYNMLKLTEHLFAWQPEVRYADFYERALYNHILASQEPEQGMFTYFMSLAPGHFRTYSTPFDSFWCCVGSGMENHTKYGKAIWFHGDDALYLNLFISSRLRWADKGLELEMRTDYPREDTVTLTVLEARGEPLALHVRSPAWAAGDLAFELNGEVLPTRGVPGSYARLERAWRSGDRLRITVPMAVRTEPLRGAPERLAFLYGPVVLAGDLGPVPRGETFPWAEEQAANFEAQRVPVPELTAAPAEAADALDRLPGPGLAFRADGVLDGRPTHVTLRPFAELHYRYYNVYWELGGRVRGAATPGFVR